jgi:hypothetical protein
MADTPSKESCRLSVRSQTSRLNLSWKQATEPNPPKEEEEKKEEEEE